MVHCRLSREKKPINNNNDIKKTGTESILTERKRLTTQVFRSIDEEKEQKVRQLIMN